MEEPNWKSLEEVLDEEELEIVGDIYDKLIKLLEDVDNDSEI